MCHTGTRIAAKTASMLYIEHVGDVIALLVMRELQKRGWSVLELAGRSGINRCVLGRWLSGRRTIKLSQAWVVLDALDLSLEVDHGEEVIRIRRRSDRDRDTLG